MASHHDSASQATAAAEAAEKRPKNPVPARDGILPLRDVEGAHVRHALEVFNWNKKQAARALGISRDTLYRKIAEQGLDSHAGASRRLRRPR